MMMLPFTAELLPKEFFIGFQIMFAGPTVINSGIVLTEQAQGDVSLALLLTIVTNVLGVFLAPVLVTRYVDFGASDPGDGHSDRF
jgi:predicted Na+-dependent transporter